MTGDLGCKAAAVLKEFLGRHPNSIRATEYLIQHLERVDLNEAYKYAKRLALDHPYNLKILLNWMNIGFNANNDKEVTPVLCKISASQKNNKSKKKLSIELKFVIYVQ